MDKKLKRVLTSLKSTSISTPSSSSTTYPDGSPEATLQTHLQSFLSPQTPRGDEVAYLPTIVESVESSPTAAILAVSILRKNLSPSTPPHSSYNAVMLLRILSDHPGSSFTRHFAGDPKFVGSVKELIRKGKDPGVWGILRETLLHFEAREGELEGLEGLMVMWRKEKSLIETTVKKKAPSAALTPVPALAPSSSPSASQQPPPPLPRRIPPPDELSARISEAESSAKLLEQVTLSSPPHEVAEDPLVKEFAERCRLAEGSVRKYIEAAEAEGLDVDTLATLLEVHEKIVKAREMWIR